ncbi:MAG TPA: electron transport complex subunit RsxC [Ruminococcaceae bacterium]|nr:electron transport complex subunit RsxC [Oscillospiraceae bacterium]
MKGYSASGILSAVTKGRGGVFVTHSKNTENCACVRFPNPEKVVLPMQQHIGAPCEPIVKVGDTVQVGQLIADTEKFVSAPIHATVSGKVSAVGDVKLPNGVISKAVTIESDGEMTLFDGIEPPKVNSRDDFVKAVRASGLVGLGGAGFPTHVKLAFSPDKNIDTLVVNAAECEPYITVDYRECMDNTDYIIRSLLVLKEYLGFKNVVIAVEDNKPKAIDKLSQAIAKLAPDEKNIRIMALKSKYPQGAEKMMVQSATGRKVPPGKLPADVGCVVMNVASVAFIARYLETGKPLVSRSLTVDGSAIHTPQNVRVPIGTNIGDIIDFCGGFTEEPFKLITGGPMMGLAIVGTDLPVLKQNNAILAFAEGTFKVKPETDCIRCGRCAAVCPMSLMPTLVTRFAKAKDVESLQDAGIMVCMECGSCSYVCPAGKPLVQHMRLAKSILREAGAKK